MTVTEIKIEVKDVNQFLVSPNSLFYRKRMLTPDAEELIMEEVTLASSKDPIHLKIHLHADAMSRKGEIKSAIHWHFAWLRSKSERQLKNVLQRGWQSLLISIIFFGLLISMTLVIIKLLPEGGFSIIFREVLIILGWVALWRPADLLLYEWRQYKREINLFRRLEKCDVEIMDRAHK